MRYRRLFVSGTLTVLVLVSTAGCGVFYWGKPGSTAEQFERDSNECAKEALQVPAAQVSRDEFDKVYRRCLTARGYVREQRPQHDKGWHRGIE